MQNVLSSSTFGIAMSVSSLILYSFLVYQFSLRASVSALISSSALEKNSSGSVDTAWYPPNATWITDLSAVVNGSGVHGFVFNDSHPQNVAYGGYNWCNMPHVRKSEYVIPSSEYELEYVELVSHLRGASFHILICGDSSTSQANAICRKHFSSRVIFLGLQ
jgi:hypothetical protein